MVMPAPKFTEEVCKLILEEIRNGVSMSDSASIHRVSKLTLDNWCKRNKDFARDLKKAESEYKREHLLNLRKASGKSWQASSWLLERKYPEEYGRRDRMDLTSKGNEIRGVVYMPVKKSEGEPSGLKKDE